MTARPQERGFTLVEMLVALTIFALLAAAGVGILRASVMTQSAVDERLAEVSALGRLHALLAADLGQAVVRPTRAASGERPAFTGSGGGFALVRAGWSNPDGDARSTLQRVEWRMARGGLERIGSATLDGGEDGQPAVIGKQVETAAFRYRSAAGAWSELWQATPEQPLPAAVELTLARSGEAPLLFVIALPPRGVEPPLVGAAT
jgi:general secretion pathway protein J